MQDTPAEGLVGNAFRHLASQVLASSFTLTISSSPLFFAAPTPYESRYESLGRRYSCSLRRFVAVSESFFSTTSFVGNDRLYVSTSFLIAKPSLRVSCRMRMQ